MQLILDIGQLMMENGASSKRVVRDMLRAAAYLGIYWENVQIHITYSTIMIMWTTASRRKPCSANATSTVST